MSSINLISHHLFVAAIHSESVEETAQQSLDESGRDANAIPLEVLGCDEPIPDLQPRPLRGAPSSGRR